VTQSADAKRFPWLFALVLVIIGGATGAWLVLRQQQTQPSLSPEGGEGRGEGPSRQNPTEPKPALIEAKPASKPIVVEIKSIPPGAIAYLDGKKLPSPTPVTIELLPDASARLKLELAGYHDLETTLTPNAPSEFTLEKEKRAVQPPPAPPPKKEFGTVRFVVKPWASVQCGEYKLGETPFADKQLPAGNYKCVFTNPDLNATHTEVVQVAPNVTTKVSVNLKP
jgi:hypothetical protein